MSDVGEKLHLMVVAAVLIQVRGSGSLSAQVIHSLISVVAARANILALTVAAACLQHSC